MSYLNPLRLHFAGKFQANVSTVNNDPGHFDSSNFKPSYHEMETISNPPNNGWFNPQGDAAFRLLGCKVVSAWMPDGAAAPAGDPVLNCLIADSDTQVCAKLVDLDTEQQLVSQIWGLQVRITDKAGQTLLRGDFLPAAFADIWDRSTGHSGGGDIGAGAMYQSVLTHLHWGDVSSSPLLGALQAAAGTGTLSIKFNVDGLNMTFSSPDFMCGRIVGTIGPAAAGEPAHMVIGRQFMADPGEGGNFFVPQGRINFCAGVVNEEAGAFLLDLGNAISTGSPGGPSNDLGDLTLGYYEQGAETGDAAGSFKPLAIIRAKGVGGYSESGWYEKTAGVLSIPLDAGQQAAVSHAPLAIINSAGYYVNEWATGAFVRADNYVFRASPGEEIHVPVYATRWGRRWAGARILFALDPAQLQAQAGNYVDPGDVPPVGTPISALKFTTAATTGEHGIAMLKISTGDPGYPRKFKDTDAYGHHAYIDGQVYGIRPSLDPTQCFVGPMNKWNFVSLLLWSGFKPGEPITWYGAIRPIFQQYANLYPIMLRFLNLGDYQAVKENLDLLTMAFSLGTDSPNSMPVTRDLSPAKRAAILSWLKNPLLGDVPATPPAPPAPALSAAPGGEGSSAHADAKGAPGAQPMRGGKAAAAARRLVLTRSTHHA